MKLSKVTIFKGSPISNFNDTLHFRSNDERDQYFLVENHFQQRLTFDAPFNLVKDNLTLKLPIAYGDTDGYNYGSFLDGFTGTRYYFYILGVRYINDGVSAFDIVIDVMMTFTQGEVLSTMNNVLVKREHLTNAEYNKRLPMLKTNGDIIPATTKKYRYTKAHIFKPQDLYVIIQCSYDLASEFGTIDKPKMNLSKGTRYDGIVSPVGLYAIERNKFPNLSRALKDFPWVGQNIQKILLVPKELITESELVDSKLNNKEFDGLKTFKEAGTSKNFFLSDMDMSEAEICEVLKIPKDETHLLRSGYSTLEINTWNGEKLDLDFGDMPPVSGIKFMLMTSLGYSNEIKIYPTNWKSNGDQGDQAVDTGSFLNDSISFSNFTELPILIDNYKASLAGSANTRAFNNSQTSIGRVKNISNSLADPNQNTLEKATSIFTDAYSLMGGGFSLATIGSKIADDTTYYRQQKAQFADLALSNPTVTSGNAGQSFQIANDIFGFTMKMSSPSDTEIDHIRKYYSSMGFEINEKKTIGQIESMTVANYLQCEGNFRLFNVPTQFMEQIRALLMVGVRFWHNDGSDNPFEQDLLQNKRRV